MKERLTGAIILVALIVLLVPELLTGPLRSKPAGTTNRAVDAPVSTQAGSAGTRPPVRSYTMTLGSSAPATGTAGPVRTPQRPAQADRSAAIAAATAPEPVPAPASASSVPPRAAARIVSPSRPAAHGGLPGRTRAPPRQPNPARAPARREPRDSPGWVVQLASFADHGNALRLTHRLRLRHLPATVAPLRLKGRMWWRVWVGPVSSRAAAVRLARRLRPIARGEVLRE